MGLFQKRASFCHQQYLLRTSPRSIPPAWNSRIWHFHLNYTLLPRRYVWNLVFATSRPESMKLTCQFRRFLARSFRPVMRFLRACSARKRPAKDGPGENRFTTWSFKPLRTLVSTFSHPFQWKMSVTWQGTQGADVEREDGFTGVQRNIHQKEIWLQFKLGVTCRIKFESLSKCQYKLSNIWIDRKVMYRLTKFY